jgi:hypothetical protein
MGGNVVLLEQPSVDFFRAQILEGGINQRSGKKRESIRNQQWIDSQGCSFIPDARITLASTAVMAKSAMQDLVG